MWTRGHDSRISEGLLDRIHTMSSEDSFMQGIIVFDPTCLWWKTFLQWCKALMMLTYQEEKKPYSHGGENREWFILWLVVTRVSPVYVFLKAVLHRLYITVIQFIFAEIDAFSVEYLLKRTIHPCKVQSSSLIPGCIQFMW